MEVVVFDPLTNATLQTYKGFIYVTDSFETANGLNVEVVTYANGTQTVVITWDPNAFDTRATENIQFYGGKVCDVLSFIGYKNVWKVWKWVRGNELSRPTIVLCRLETLSGAQRTDAWKYPASKFRNPRARSSAHHRIQKI
jgi:hypothetical protein